MSKSSANEKVRQSALEKRDAQLTSLSTEELIVKEAYYHSSCYSNYTITLYHHNRGNAINTQSIPDIAFAAIKIHLTDLHKNPDVIEFTKFTKKVEAKLSFEKYDPKQIDSAKQNSKITQNISIL